MNPVYVRGLGLWTPGYDRPLAWCQQKLDPAALKPAAALLEGPLRRRATPLTRMAVEAFQQATSHADRDPATVPTVWATAHGEHSPAIKLLEMMQRGAGKLSPTHFHNSVHNTAGGYASIATGNVAPSTTLTGGSEIVASALLEVWCLIESAGHDVALVLADEALQSPFDRADARTPLAVALLLSQQPEHALGVLTELRRATIAPVPEHEHFGHLHVSAALPLLEHIVRGQPGIVPLEHASGGPGPVWCVDLRVGSGNGRSQ
jgi:hypothetical protein